MRKCNRCGNDKEDVLFSFKDKLKGIRQNYCKECHKKYSAIHYIQNSTTYKERAKISNRKMYSENSEYLNKYKETRGCKYCNENDSCCLDFHHHSDNKEYSVSNKKNVFGKDKLLLEIEKCDVVCSNCHRKLHAGKELSIRREI